MKKTIAVETKDQVQGAAKGVFEIDGQSYRLVYDFAQIARAEGELGANLLIGLTSIGSLSAIQLAGLVLAGVRAADPPVYKLGEQVAGCRLTFAQIGLLIRYDTILQIVEALAESLILSSPAKGA